VTFLGEALHGIGNNRVNEDCSLSSLKFRRRSNDSSIRHSFDHSNWRSGLLAVPYTASSRKRTDPIVIDRKRISTRKSERSIRAFHIRPEVRSECQFYRLRPEKNGMRCSIILLKRKDPLEYVTFKFCPYGFGFVFGCCFV